MKQAHNKPFPYSAETVARALGGRATSKTEVRAPGPGHSSKDDSLVITIYEAAPDGFLVFSHANDNSLQCKDHVRERLGMASWQKGSGRRGTDYIYRNAHGAPYMKVTRTYSSGGKKYFTQYRCENDDWVKGTKGLARIPYRLDELVASPNATVHFVEGEKDADRLAAEGLIATSAPEGASAKWDPKMTEWFRGRTVIILPDNDQPGRGHAEKVANALAGVASSVKIIELPDLNPKGDVSDWLNAGHTADELASLCEQALPRPANDNQRLDETIDLGGPFRGLITESDIAQRFVDLFANEMRYDHSRGTWHLWNGKRWQVDETQVALSLARRLAFDSSEGHEGKVQVAVRKASFARAVETLSRSDQRVAVTASAWDRDSFQLGTPDGAVDLKSGVLLPADRMHMITQSTSVAPASRADCPIWFKFLAEVTGHDLGLVRFLQQWCGYALTGVTSEHALVFAYGPGGNGKSVFLNTVSHILGDYAVTAAMDTFVASKDSKHPTDLAMLAGKRLVTASETEEGRPWAESRIKQLTGSDPISARFMRQNFFTYIPQFKLTIVGNHHPVLKNVDDAMRRRINIVPFTHKPAEPDHHLESKLKAEAPAILRWMIDGCLDWQANGLVRPNVINEATRAYFADQDLVAQWLAECCEVERGNEFKKAKASALFNSFKAFALEAGEQAGTAKALSTALEQRGFAKKRSNSGVLYLGLRLREPVFN